MPQYSLGPSSPGGPFLLVREVEKNMPNRVIELSFKRKGNGVQIQGITRSDRGTKYILRSEDVDYTGKTKEEQEKEVQSAALRVLEGA